MAKKWFEIKAEAGAKKASVSIRGLIGEWGVTDRDFIAEVEALGDLTDLDVFINSRGGDVDHAVGIFNFLRDHPAHVTTINEGVAMSSGSLIMMAGDTIKVKANSITMIHNPWTFAAGNAKQLRSQADILDKFEHALRSVYVARTGKSEEDIKAMLDGPDGDGIHMTADEAKAEGFADEVIPLNIKKGASAMAMACALGIPDSVLAKVQEIEAATTTITETETETTTTEKTTVIETTDPAADPAANPAQDQTVTDQLNAMIVAAGFSDMASVWLLDDKMGTVDAVKESLAQAREIRALCAAAKLPDEAAKLIRDRADMPSARKHLTDILAAADEATHTSSHQPSKNGKPANNDAKPAALKTADVWASRRKQIH